MIRNKLRAVVAALGALTLAFSGASASAKAGNPDVGPIELIQKASDAAPSAMNTATVDLVSLFGINNILGTGDIHGSAADPAEGTLTGACDEGDATATVQGTMGVDNYDLDDDMPYVPDADGTYKVGDPGDFTDNSVATLLSSCQVTATASTLTLTVQAGESGTGVSHVTLMIGTGKAAVTKVIAVAVSAAIVAKTYDDTATPPERACMEKLKANIKGQCNLNHAFYKIMDGKIAWTLPEETEGVALEGGDFYPSDVHDAAETTTVTATLAGDEATQTISYQGVLGLATADITSSGLTRGHGRLKTGEVHTIMKFHEKFLPSTGINVSATSSKPAAIAVEVAEMSVDAVAATGDDPAVEAHTRYDVVLTGKAVGTATITVTASQPDGTETNTHTLAWSAKVSDAPINRSTVLAMNWSEDPDQQADQLATLNSLIKANTESAGREITYMVTGSRNFIPGNPKMAGDTLPLKVIANSRGVKAWPDYETAKELNFTVEAKAGTTTDKVAIKLMVQDHDEPPHLRPGERASQEVNVLATGAIPGYVIHELFEDPEGQGIDIDIAGSVSSDEKVATVSHTGAIVTITPKAAAIRGINTARITIKAKETAGKKQASDDAVTVTVRVMTGVNTPPQYKGGAVGFEVTVDENVSAIGGTGGEWTADDVDTSAGDVVTHGIAGSLALGSLKIKPEGGTCLAASARSGAIYAIGIGGPLARLCPGPGFNYEAMGPKKSTVITLMATDRFGGEARVPLTINVKDVDEAPHLVSRATTKLRLLIANGQHGIDLATIFSDPEGGALTYAPSSNNRAIATASVTGSMLNIRPRKAGEAIISLSAADPSGKSVAHKITVTVRESNTGPVFPGGIESVTYTVAENARVGSKVGTPNAAVDPDEGDSLKYAVTGAAFSVDSKAQLRVKTGLDFETQTTYVLYLTVTDEFGESDRIRVTVNVNDVNERPTATEAEIPDQLVVNGGVTSFAATTHFDDPDEVDKGRLFVTPVVDNPLITTVKIDSEGVAWVFGDRVGKTSVVLEALDSGGNPPAKKAFNVMVAENEAPTVAGDGIGDRSVVMGTTANIMLDGVFTDPNVDIGDMVSVTSASSDDEAHVLVLLTSDGSTLTVVGRALGKADVTVTAEDTGGLSVSDTFEVSVVEGNHAPTVYMALGDLAVMEGGSTIVDVAKTFVDTDAGDSLTISARSADSDVASVSVSGTSVTVSGVMMGRTQVTVTATDMGGESASDTFSVTVESGNTAPMVAMEIDDQTVTEGESVDVDVSDTFSDDGDELTISASSKNDEVATAEADGHMVTVAGVAPGATVITVTATDSGGLSASTSFAVGVEVANTAPTVAMAIDDQSVTRGDSPVVIDISGTFFDEDEDDMLTITAMTHDGSIVDAILNEDFTTLTIDGLAPGTTVVTLTATDLGGLSVSTTVNIMVDTRPEAIAALAPIALEIGGGSVDRSVSDLFMDDDGDTLTLTVASGTQGIASTTLAGMNLMVAPLSRGNTMITVTATDAAGYTASVSTSVAVGDGELRKVAEQSLAGFGRAVLSSVSNAVGSRLLADAQNSDLSLGAFAPTSSFAGVASADGNDDVNMLHNRSGANLWTTGHKSTNSRYAGGLRSALPKQFAMQLNDGTDGMGTWSVWGTADRQAFEGTAYDGMASSVYLGVDVQAAECWLFGVAVARNGGETDYRYGTAEQTMETSLTTILPYFRYEPDPRSAIWGVAGVGSGELETTVVGASDATSDLSMNLYMLGGRRQVTNIGRLDLALRGDVAMASFESEDGSGAADGLSADIHRVRAGLEGSFLTETGNGGTLAPFAEISLRQDGGDGDTGSGIEFSGGVRVNSEVLSLEARGRVLAMHGAEDYSENGFSLMATLNPAADGTGISVTLAPRWGGSVMDSGMMWGENTTYGQGGMTHFDMTDNSSSAIEARVGYGMRVSNERYMLTPFVDVDVTDTDRRQYMVGATLQQLIRGSATLGVDLSLGRVERRSTGEADAQVGLNATLRF